MAERRMHLLEEATGTGDLYRGDEWLAQVHYSLTVREEILAVESESGAEELPGLRTTGGEIEILGIEQDLTVNSAAPYSLHLSDGRSWNFRATERIPESGVYQVTNAGARGLS